MNEQLQRFRSWIEPFMGDWCSIDLKVIAQRTKDGQWLFNSIRAVLDTELPNTPTVRDLPSPSKLLVAHERWDMQRLNELLESISDGELVVSNQIIRLKRWDGHDWQPLSSGHSQIWDRDRCRSESGIDYFSFVYRIWESNPISDHEDHRLVDADLRSGEPPWDGLTDLRKNFLGFDGSSAQRTDSLTCDVIAPLGVRLGEASFLQGEKVVALLETKLANATKNIGLSVIAKLQDNSIIRLYRSLSSNESKFSVPIDLPKKPLGVSIIASHGGIDVDDMEFYETANPRFVVLEKLGAGMPTLKSSIEEARGRELEQWCAILFHLLGFSPAHYGGTKLEAPDIVAFPDSADWLLLIECTAREPDLNRKLTKLATRTKEIYRAIGGLTITQVLLTTMTRPLLNTTDLEKASKEGIVVVTADELSNLLQMASEGATPKEVHDFLLSLKSSHLYGGVWP